MDIKNFLQMSDTISTSGQPTETEFDAIAGQGFKTVINLALSTSSNAIPMEDQIVAELGMSYVHIPVLWEKPTTAQFAIFASVMQSLAGEKVWVHCALNMRVSSFLFLYSVKYLSIEISLADKKMRQIWQPNDVWQHFIDRVLTDESS